MNGKSHFFLNFFHCFFLCFFLTSCGHLFYHPKQELFSTPDKQGLKYQEIMIEGRLASWHIFHSSEKFKGTIIFFHGNAENRSTHYRQLAWLTTYGYDLLIVDYSGYGGSQGVAGRKALAQDTRDTLNYVFKTLSPPYILYGQSLGGNLAMEVAWEFPLDLLVVDSSFLSYQNIAKDRLQLSWVTFPLSFLASVLINEKHSASLVWGQYQGKLLVLHSKKDQIVPFEFGEEIYNTHQGAKDYLWFEDQAHIQAFYYEKYRQDFLVKMENLLRD
jgi:fermentation-respiration switch protein FrsA (DUF1100 family)